MPVQEDEEEEELFRRYVLTLEDYDKRRQALEASFSPDVSDEERVELREALHATTAKELQRLPVLPMHQYRTLFRKYGYQSLHIQNDLQLVSQEMQAIVRRFVPSGRFPGLVNWNEETFSHFVGRLMELRTKHQFAHVLVGPVLADQVMEYEAERLFQSPRRQRSRLLKGRPYDDGE